MTMIEPGTEKAGRKVVYKPFPGCDPELYEEGVITSWNDHGIFVRYGNDTISKSTYRRDLEYINEL